MSGQWRGLAVVLRIGLIVAAGIAIPAAIVVALRSAPAAAEVLATWRQAAVGNQEIPRLTPRGEVAEIASRTAIAALIAIPGAGYATICIMFVRRRRIAYATMAVLQLLLLLSVAVGAV